MRALDASIRLNRRFGAAVLLTALVASGVGIAWAFRPSEGAASGELAFVRDGAAIYVVKVDGTGLRRLKGSSGPPAYDPDWSPDGGRLVFAQRCLLYVMKADGTGMGPLGFRRYCPKEPAWSPDGRRIAFSARSEHDQNVGVIAVTDVRGSSVTFLSQKMKTAKFDDEFPDWSPDGTQIVFSRTRHTGSAVGSPDPAVVIMDAAGGRLRKLPPQASAEAEAMPSWSPDGSKIALGLVREAHSYVYVSDLSGRRYENLSPRPTTDAGGGDMGMTMPGERFPSWSSDGSRLAFGTDHGITVMRADGSARRRVTSHAGDDGPRWRPGSASAGGMRMDWWPWWITSLVGILAVAAASWAFAVIANPRARAAAATAIVVAGGLAIAAPVVMTPSENGSGGGSPSMMER